MLANPTGEPITLSNETTEMSPLVTDKAIKDLSK